MIRRLQSGQSIGIVGLGIGLLVVGVLVFLSLAPVRFGTVKAVTFAGGLSGVVYDQGLNFKLPWQGTQTFNIQRQTYEASENPNSSTANFTDFVIAAKTADGQSIEVSYTVIFRIVPSNVVSVLDNYGSMDAVVENIVKAKSRSEARKSAQNYEAGTLYSGVGIKLYESEVAGILAEGFADEGVFLVEFLIRGISFERLYVDAITAKQIAAENIVTQSNNARAAVFERDRAVTLAEADAAAKVLLAEADAARITLLADAQALAITLQGVALDEYPQMTQWEFVSHLANVSWGFLPSEGITPLIPIPTP